MKVELTRVTENPVLAIEEAASNCYDSVPDSNGRIMRGCYKSGHQSVLEFADFTFHIEGVSRALLAQITRHRMASFAVRSQRYCSEDGFKYVVPKTIQEDENLMKEYIEFMSNTQKFYNKLQEADIPNEDARFILPNACETIMEVKMNGRELIHFMNERLCTRAQWEIRNLAVLMKKAVKDYNQQCEKFAEFLVPKCEINKDYPFCTESKSCGRHPKLKDIYKVE